MAELEAAREEMRTWITPGMTVYTQLEKVARSGMVRYLRAKIVEDGEIRDITWSAANALNIKTARDGSIKIHGYGMDAGFKLVYDLGWVLYQTGFECIGEIPVRCPSNDHFNGDRNYTPHHHDNGGYALIQRWL